MILTVKDYLIGNIVTHLCNANKEILISQTKLCHTADHEYGRRVAEGLKLDLK
jgi:catalase